MGRIEVFYNNEWGTVCNDLFTTVDGNVVCQMLNFTMGALCVPSSFRSFPPGTGNSKLGYSMSWEDKEIIWLTRSLHFFFYSLSPFLLLFLLLLSLTLSLSLSHSLSLSLSGQIWLDNVRCTSTDEVLEDCDHNGWGNHNCGHSDDVGVVCRTSKIGTLLAIKIIEIFIIYLTL